MVDKIEQVDRAFFTATTAKQTVGCGLRSSGDRRAGGADFFTAPAVDATLGRLGSQQTPTGDDAEQQAGWAEINAPKTRKNN